MLLTKGIKQYMEQVRMRGGVYLMEVMHDYVPGM
jgi:hypothetical protein